MSDSDDEPLSGEEEEFMETEEDLPKDPAVIQQEAEDRRNEGNTAYKAKDYYKAIRCYTNAINLLPETPQYYGNRSAAYMMISNYQAALNDANKSVEKDPAFTKGTVRVIKCHIALGNLTAASRAMEDLKTRDPSHSTSEETKNVSMLREYETTAEKDSKSGEHRRVVFTMDRALVIAPACTQYKVRRAESLACLGRYQEAQEAANDMLRSHSLNAGALYVKGLCLFYQDNIDKARQHFLQVLRVDPDHSKAKLAVKRAKELDNLKSKGNTAFTTGKYEEALTLYTDALKVDPNNRLTNAKLHCNVAAVKMKLNKHEEALQSCTKAIDLDGTYIKAYARRATCYQELDQHEEAVRDCEKMHNMDHSRETKQRLRDANLKLKMSKRKDYYKILGCTKNATDDEIKKSYKKCAMKHHPDKNSHGTEDQKVQAEKSFKECGEAYAVLSDQNKKMRYDNGEDLDECGGRGDVDPTKIFETFFGGGGGGFGGHPGFGGRQQGGHGHPGYTFSFG